MDECKPLMQGTCVEAPQQRVNGDDDEVTNPNPDASTPSTPSKQSINRI